MPIYLGFLRAVNVANRQYPMARLRDALTGAGFADVETYIQTGNVRVRSSMRSPDKVRAALERAFVDDISFEVPTLVFTPGELSRVHADAVRIAAEHPHTSHYVTLVANPLSEAARAEIEARSIEDETIRGCGRAVHLLLNKSFHEARSGTNAVERIAGVATTRNMTVLSKLADKWGE